MPIWSQCELFPLFSHEIHSMTYSLIALQQNNILLEIRELILTYCSWTEYHSLYQTDTRFHFLVQHAISRHIHDTLSSFVTSENQVGFWALMDATASCIIRGFVHTTMFKGDTLYQNAAPTQLDIVVPKTFKRPLTTTL